MRYYEQPPTKITGLDYSSPSTLHIPLPAGGARLWNAQTVEEWQGIVESSSLGKAVKKFAFISLADFSLADATRSDMASASAFDFAIVLAALSLQLPKRRSLTKVNIQNSASDLDPAVIRLASVFPDLGPSNAYLALHYTPLHILLSVSGDSWVFNKKVPQASDFADHHMQLQRWRESGSVLIATAFAARALKAFLGPCTQSTASGEPVFKPTWVNICDYWGFYVCTLIVWAYGSPQTTRLAHRAMPHDAALQYIHRLAQLRPAQLQELPDRREAQGIVGLARHILEQDCVGGRSILIADAVNVLRKLGEGAEGFWS